MNRKHTHHVALLTIASALLMTFVTTGCGGLKPRHAPFHVFNSNLLNAEPSVGIPRASSDVQLHPVAWRNEPTDPVETPHDTGTAVASAEPVASPHHERRDDRATPRAPAPGKAVAVPGKKHKASDKVRKLEDASPARTAYTPRDAAGYVGAICQMNGVGVDVGVTDNAIAELYSAVKSKGKIYHATRPAVGDLMFFHNTFDRNRDSRNNDWYTHVGVVEGVDDDGTIHLLSFFSGRVQSSVVNLEHPEFERNDASGKLWNSPLRDKVKGEPAFTQHLASELFAGFGNVLGDRTEFIVIDNWVPGMVVSQR